MTSKSKSKNRDAGRDRDSDSGRVSHNWERCREEWVRFSAWNVRSLRGREEKLIQEMKKYRLEVLGVSETKMKGNGSMAVGEGRCIFAGVEEGGCSCYISVKVGESESERVEVYK